MNPNCPPVAFQQRLNNICIQAYWLPETLPDLKELSPEEQGILVRCSSAIFYHQKAWSFVLTRFLLGRVLGVEHFDIVRDQGKPFIVSKDLEFNVSHSDHLWAIAWAFNTPVGIDVQKMDPSIAYQKIAKHFFSKAECESIDNYQDFFEIWARKEAILKLKGLSVNRMKSIDTNDTTIVTHALHIHPQFQSAVSHHRRL